MFQSSFVHTSTPPRYSQGPLQVPQPANHSLDAPFGSDLNVGRAQITTHHEDTDDRPFGGVQAGWRGPDDLPCRPSNPSPPLSPSWFVPDEVFSPPMSPTRRTKGSRKGVPGNQQERPSKPSNCFMVFRTSFQKKLPKKTPQTTLSKAAAVCWNRMLDEEKRPYCEVYFRANDIVDTFQRHCKRSHKGTRRTKAKDGPDPDQEAVDKLIALATSSSTEPHPGTGATHSRQDALSNFGPPHLPSRPVWAGACAPQVSYQLDVTRPTRPVTPVTSNPVTTFPSPSSSHSSAASLSDELYDFNQFPLTMPYYDTSFEVPPPLSMSNFDFSSNPPLQVGPGNLSGFFDPNQITDSIYNHPFGGLAVNDDTPQRTFGGADDNLLTPFPGEIFDATRHYPNINF